MDSEHPNRHNPENTQMAEGDFRIAMWDKTRMAEERARHSPLYEEPDAEARHGYFKGRQIIGRDTHINNGVYIGGGKREAIVIDDSKDDQLNIAYKELESIMNKIEALGEKYKNNILNEVFDLTKIKLPYNNHGVNLIFKKYGLSEDTKIRLGIYIAEGAGVCRHQALLAAYLLEKLKLDGKINGVASIDRNYIKAFGGHAWVRYTNSKGDVYIIDPAQDFIGSLEDAEKKGKWSYKRPEDK